MKYYRFREKSNADYGTIDYYIPMTLKQHARLKETISLAEGYALSDEGVSGAEVDRLIKGHENSNSEVAVIAKCAPMKSVPRVDNWYDFDPFYGGGAFKIVSCTKNITKPIGVYL